MKPYLLISCSLHAALKHLFPVVTKLTLCKLATYIYNILGEVFYAVEYLLYNINNLLLNHAVLKYNSSSYSVTSISYLYVYKYVYIV